MQSKYEDHGWLHHIAIFGVLSLIPATFFGVSVGLVMNALHGLVAGCIVFVLAFVLLLFIAGTDA